MQIHKWCKPIIRKWISQPLKHTYSRCTSHTHTHTKQFSQQLVHLQVRCRWKAMQLHRSLCNPYSSFTPWETDLSQMVTFQDFLHLPILCFHHQNPPVSLPAPFYCLLLPCNLQFFTQTQTFVPKKATLLFFLALIIIITATLSQSAPILCYSAILLLIITMSSSLEDTEDDKGTRWRQAVSHRQLQGISSSSA